MYIRIKRINSWLNKIQEKDSKLRYYDNIRKEIEIFLAEEFPTAEFDVKVKDEASKD